MTTHHGEAPSGRVRPHQTAQGGESGELGPMTRSMLVTGGPTLSAYPSVAAFESAALVQPSDSDPRGAELRARLSAIHAVAEQIERLSRCPREPAVDTSKLEALAERVRTLLDAASTMARATRPARLPPPRAPAPTAPAPVRRPSDPKATLRWEIGAPRLPGRLLHGH